MPWQSHLDGGNHLGQTDPGTAAEAEPQLPAESPNGTPLPAQPAPIFRIGMKEILIVMTLAAVTFFVLKTVKK